MTVIMLLEDEEDKAGALVEAAVDLSRVLGAEICCLDLGANTCTTPAARALRRQTQGVARTAEKVCDLCVERDADQCRPLMRRATFIVSRSAATLERAVAQGYGPVLLVPPGQQHFQLAGRAVIALDGSPAIARNIERVLPLLHSASSIDIVVTRSAAPSDGEDLAALLARQGCPSTHDVPIHVTVSREADVGRECERLNGDWCLVGAEPASVAEGQSVLATQMLNDPPCPLLVAV